MTGDIDFQTGHFGYFEQFKINVHFPDYGQVKIDHICFLLLTLNRSELFYC